MKGKYLDATIKQALERARVLKAKIPNPAIAPELIGLQRICEREIEDIIRELRYLLENDQFNDEQFSGERIRLFRRTQWALLRLESSGISALNRFNNDDAFLSKVLHQIHLELKYPLAPPTVTCLSQQYYSIDPNLCLLSVPLAESDFLLHLPDLYHELGHLLIHEKNNPKISGFQEELGRCLGRISDHFQKERIANAKITGPKEYYFHVLNSLERSWADWVIELFCDLFAVYVIGPAFIWSHLLLVTKLGEDPFDARTRLNTPHPPDHARFEAMLIALKLISKNGLPQIIEARWKDLLDSLGAKEDSFFRMACPRSLLEHTAVHALEGTKKIGCKLTEKDVSGTIHSLLNDAWSIFWDSPTEYQSWERERISELRKLTSVSTELVTNTFDKKLTATNSN